MTNVVEFACEAVIVADETAADVAAREALLDQAMGPGRFAKTCERLREGHYPAPGLALVARLGDRVVGTVRLWPVVIGTDRPALMLGPLAVDPKLRSAGVGGALMRASLARAAAFGHGAVMLVGDAPYYERFGFSAAPMAGVTMPGPVDRARLLGLELEAGALASACGMVRAAADAGRRGLREAA